ncbi:MAG TPA: hypothetical protein VGK59_18560 [Ohtaekwangia sp.]
METTKPELDSDYKLIPMSEISDEAHEIAVRWIENYEPYGSLMPEIAQKHKLASDFMNFARRYHEKMIKK